MRSNLFDVIETPTTEGIKYTGSKLKLIPYIIEEIKDLKIKTILDGFSGTTRVAQAFSQLGYDSTCNDVSEWSEVFGNCYLLATKPDSYYQEILDFTQMRPMELNTLLIMLEMEGLLIKLPNNSYIMA